MLTSYHVHSIFSDGSNTIREIARAAAEAGLDEIGISDHYVLLPGARPVEWSMPPDALPTYLDEIRAAAGEFGDRVTIRYGLEADYDPHTVNELREALSAHPFDYVIGSVHFVDGFPIDESPEPWDAMNEAERDDMMRAYWARIALMADSGLFDFAGHLDLYKKFGHLPTADISADIDAALDAIARSGMAAELNTAGWFKPDIREAYPSPAIVRQCFARGIPMLVTADAHSASGLATAYDRGVRLLSEMGYSETPVFEKRRMKMVPLRAAGI